MDNNKNLMWRNSMNYGSIMSLGLIISSVIQSVFHLEESDIFKILNYFVINSILFIGIIKYREFQNGFITYGKAFLSGFLISFIASVIFSIYIFINYTFIDVNGIDKILKELEDFFIAQGIADEQVEVFMSIYNKYLTPLVMSIFNIFSLTFSGVIFSIIISFFVKKTNDNPFQNITTNSNENTEN